MKSGNMMNEAACKITKILNRTRCNIWVNRMENQCFGKTGVGWQDGIL